MSRKKSLFVYILSFLLFFSFFSFISVVPAYSAEPKPKEIETVIPSCTSVGELQCAKGFKAICPKQHKPTCIFVGTMQLPACLADSADDTFFSYNLNNIVCKKNK